MFILTPTLSWPRCRDLSLAVYVELVSIALLAKELLFYVL